MLRRRFCGYNSPVDVMMLYPLLASAKAVLDVYRARKPKI